MSDSSRWEAIRGASLPLSDLEALADLRREPELAVILDDGRAWLRWDGEDEALVLRLMAIAGVKLYDRREGLWYPHGHRVPAFGLPVESNGLKPLHAVVLPQSFAPVLPGAEDTLSQEGEGMPRSR